MAVDRFLEARTAAGFAGNEGGGSADDLAGGKPDHDDAVGAIRHVLFAESLRGPVNAVAPTPVTNAEFTRLLARALRRPAFMRVPPFVARLAFGEMADALLLASARVMPVRLRESGYQFRFPELEGALRYLLRRVE